ncbi:MAG: DUF4198 domain-containing protein [Planctomycetaceae bacterium]|nr:DUF4198 domain-containing protein [Planctomycetaceae bacterium]
MKTLSLAYLYAVVAFFSVLSARTANAHDTWVETASLTVRQNEWLYVDLRLGNHGNEHRDFKLASKITLAPCTLTLISPDGKQVDLKPNLKDLGNAEKEGYWSARVVAEQTGLYQVWHTLDTLHGKVRAVKSSKTFFVSRDNGPASFDAASQHTIGSGLEFMLETPINQLAAGKPISLTVLWKGKPAPNVRVAFVPRGETLSPGEDKTYERVSDQNGRVEFTPREGNLVLAVAHYVAEDEKSEKYEKTHYGATLVLPVPQNGLK